MNAGVHSAYICWKIGYFIYSFIQIIQHYACLNKYLVIENQVQEEETM